MSNCSKKCHTSEKFREENSNRLVQIKDLRKYRDNLKKLNDRWEEKSIAPSDNELSLLKLNYDINEKQEKKKILKIKIIIKIKII